jgi:TetR/AcrR family transcriptional regulator
MRQRRRRGDDESSTRTAILDAVEQIMNEEGYAAVTSRKIASTANLKSQLVHYYFENMDELFIALYKRKDDQYMALLQQAFHAPDPLKSLWRLNMDEKGPRITSEYMALAKHRPAISDQIARTVEKNRRVQFALISTILKDKKISLEDISPATLAMLMTGISNLFHLESPLGIDIGHSEVSVEIERLIEGITTTVGKTTP